MITCRRFYVPKGRAEQRRGSGLPPGPEHGHGNGVESERQLCGEEPPRFVEKKIKAS
jgi:hypothetical protein